VNWSIVDFDPHITNIASLTKIDLVRPDWFNDVKNIGHYDVVIWDKTRTMKPF